MQIDQVKKAIKVAYTLKRPLLLSGPPGVGKTQAAQQVAKELDVPIKVVHMPTRLVEDFGIPDMVNAARQGYLSYTLPDWWPTAEKDGSEGILLFDDRNQAGNDLQKVLANILQERELHGHKLPSGWSVISTGNRKQDRAGSNRVLSHLANRETELEVEISVDTWSEWALSAGVDARLVAFFGFRPALLLDFNPDRDRNPTPRTWTEGVNPLLSVMGPDDPLFFRMAAGAVGEGAASEMVSFMRTYEALPDIKAILEGAPLNIDHTQLAVMYAATSALAMQTETEAQMANAIKALDTLGKTEFCILYMRMVVKRNDRLANTKTFSSWVIHNSEAFQ